MHTKHPATLSDRPYPLRHRRGGWIFGRLLNACTPSVTTHLLLPIAATEPKLLKNHLFAFAPSFFFSAVLPLPSSPPCASVFCNSCCCLPIRMCLACTPVAVETSANCRKKRQDKCEARKANAAQCEFGAGHLTYVPCQDCKTANIH